MVNEKGKKQNKEQLVNKKSLIKNKIKNVSGKDGLFVPCVEI